MIITTAGHIDHGKTALVRALTGTDTDRLPEERARGITIDLGFAYRRAAGGGLLGFVDVPGHERLLRTMVAGASGTDLALIVVAADDGVKPQTREHVAVLDLLGLRQAVVAITKADRVDAARVSAVAAEIAALLAPTAMAGAPALPCDSLRGTGVDAIGAALEDTAAALQGRSAAGRFRLAVDRSFVLPGIGLVAAGFVHAGAVQPGDRLLVTPGGDEVRVRGLRIHDRPAERAVAGDRVALNLSGPRADRERVGRGDWIVDPVLHQPTARLDVRLRLLDDEPRPLRHWTAVHLHLGTATSLARVGLQRPIEPGETAPAQLVLAAPIAALCGDRFALRDASATRTIGGGGVLDPFAPPRRLPDRPALLAGWALDQDEAALAALLEASPAGLDLAQFQRARNLGAAETVTAAAVRVGGLGLSPGHWASLQSELETRVAADDWGATAAELAAALPRPRRGLAAPAIRALIDAGRLARTGNLLHLAGREIRLVPADAALWEEAQAALAAAGLDPPRFSALSERLGAEPATLRTLLERLARLGSVHRASPGYYILPEVVERFAAVARALVAESPDGLLTVGRFRERTGIARHATMPVLELFDRLGITRRIKEGRRLAD